MSLPEKRILRLFVLKMFILVVIVFNYNYVNSFSLINKLSNIILEPIHHARLLDLVKAIEDKKDISVFIDNSTITFENVNNIVYKPETLGYTLLQEAIKFDNMRAVELLLSMGASPNIKDNQGNTSLHIAALYKRLDYILILLKCNADYNIFNKQGYTFLNIKSFAYGDNILHTATRFNNIKLVKCLLKIGANPNSTNRDGHTPLHLAVNNDADIYLPILETGLEDKDISMLYFNTLTNFTNLAAESDNLDIIQELLSYKANCNIHDNKGYSPLDLATSLKKDKAISMLTSEAVTA